MNILGIWDGHDSGAALLQDGRLAAAINEERLTRRKLEMRFPSRSIDACSSTRGRARRDRISRPSRIPIRRRRWAAGGRPARSATTPRGGARRRPARCRRLTRRLKYRITEWKPPIAAGALSRSRCALRSRASARPAPAAAGRSSRGSRRSGRVCVGFAPCAVVTIDGVGDGLSATISAFRDGRLDRVAASPASASLGVFFEPSPTCSTCASSKTRAR